ncbi:sialin [Plakobranchus ocellatus]|uniref:Sialin n=1 Tax=Plakobranchus ocellatus TaxID=259542 RepID=A0AAV4BAM3_9GAST|nr:sialin [Plakobranchus ocellatus]
MTELEKAPFFKSQRFVLAFMAFLGKMFMYCARVNLSVAIVCMVKDNVNRNVEDDRLTDTINISSITASLVIGNNSNEEMCGRRLILNETSQGKDV